MAVENFYLVWYEWLIPFLLQFGGVLLIINVEVKLNFFLTLNEHMELEEVIIKSKRKEKVLSVYAFNNVVIGQ